MKKVATNRDKLANLREHLEQLIFAIDCTEREELFKGLEFEETQSYICSQLLTGMQNLLGEKVAK